VYTTSIEGLKCCIGDNSFIIITKSITLLKSSLLQEADRKSYEIKNNTKSIIELQIRAVLRCILAKNSHIDRRRSLLETQRIERGFESVMRRLTRQLIRINVLK